MLVVVISEHESIRSKMINVLESYEVLECSDFLDAVATMSLRKNECNIVLADYSLNPFGGIELLSIAKKMNCSIRTVLLISGSDVEAEIKGLKSDVDLVMNYEKVATVNKAYIQKLMEKEVKQQVYLNGMELIVNGKAIVLSRIDLQILNLLIKNAGNVVTREEILEKVWGQSNQSVRKVEMHARAIRKMLEGEGVRNSILTVSGVGYKWGCNQST